MMQEFYNPDGTCVNCGSYIQPQGRLNHYPACRRRGQELVAMRSNFSMMMPTFDDWTIPLPTFSATDSWTQYPKPFGRNSWTFSFMQYWLLLLLYDNCYELFDMVAEPDFDDVLGVFDLRMNDFVPNLISAQTTSVR